MRVNASGALNTDDSHSPNSGFLAQLEIFEKASYKVAKQDKGVRMFYLERLVKAINSASCLLHFPLRK